MASRKPQTHIGQLIHQGMAQKNLNARRLEQLCGFSQGYLTKLMQGEIEHPGEEHLGKLAYHLSQRIEDYRGALAMDHHELPAPAAYFSAMLGETVDEETAELGMKIVADIVTKFRHKDT